jgi:hypothetical protein
VRILPPAGDQHELAFVGLSRERWGIPWPAKQRRRAQGWIAVLDLNSDVEMLAIGDNNIRTN